MMELDKKLFSEYPREAMKRLFDEKIEKKTRQMTDVRLFDDDKGIRDHAMRSADLVCLIALRYILADNEGYKPWLVRKSLDRVVDLKEFPDYTDKLVRWLQASPPYDTLGKAVYIHQIIRNLTTMELK